MQNQNIKKRNDSHSCCHGHHRDPTIKPTKAYFCPMCPGVESDEPGDCPKCGMPLEANPLMASDHEQKEIRTLTLKFWIGLVLALPVFLLSMTNKFVWIQFMLTAIVIGWAGGFLFVRGWRSFVNRSLNMFTLITVGVGAAYTYSVAAVLFPHLFPDSLRHNGMLGLYFESAAVITVLVILGQLLEAKARSRTGQAIKSLLNIAAKTAHRVRDGKEEEISIKEIKIGDSLRVRPGEKVPTDGVILEGRSALDESLITGEPLPVEKKEGDPIIGSSINQSGSFLMRADKIGADTLLAHIVHMVADAQRSRAPIQKLADRVSGFFVPTVIGIAILTAIAWAVWGPTPVYAVVNAVAVLIIACPCALGLATPMSITVGIGRGAQSGILIRNAEALEKAEKITHLITDKTGTLTAGKPKVTDTICATGIKTEILLSLAASLEALSEHPLARAIVQEAQTRAIPTVNVTEFESVTGGGVKGRVDGKMTFIGKEKFIQEMGAEISAELRNALDDLERAARTVVIVTQEQVVLGLIGVSDPIKETSAIASRRLRDLGIKIIMATGDNPHTAQAVAHELGISEVHAGLMPHEKLQLVEKLKKQGAVVAMAGDGINDAPALATADIGIAMGTGTDVAIQSADITLVKGDLQGIAKAFLLSRAVMKNIRQNLFFAFVYNILGIPIAAGVLYPFFEILLNPMIAGAAMAFSSVSVITNSLRLRKLSL